MNKQTQIRRTVRAYRRARQRERASFQAVLHFAARRDSVLPGSDLEEHAESVRYYSGRLARYSRASYNLTALYLSLTTEPNR